MQSNTTLSLAGCGTAVQMPSHGLLAQSEVNVLDKNGETVERPKPTADELCCTLEGHVGSFHPHRAPDCTEYAFDLDYAFDRCH